MAERIATLQAVQFHPESDRRFALDRAHRGDIEGALGHLSSLDTAPRTTLRRHFSTLLAIAGPGLIVMLASNDAGGISVYAQAGKIFGLRIIAAVVGLGVVLYVNQEMVARIGAVTGVGHARMICERFGRRWGAFALTDLLILNLLTVVIDFVGVRFALGYFGVSRFLSVPLAAAVLVAAVVSGRFRRWERVMYGCIAASLISIPLVLFSHRSTNAASTSLLLGHMPHGTNGAIFAIALLGTTIAPWQFFFQQSNVVDKRITTRWLNYERVDTAIGTVLFVVCSLGVLLSFSFAFAGTHFHGAAANASVLSHQLRTLNGPTVGTLFAIVLLNGSIFGASAVSLATSYAVGDYLGVKHSLHRSWREAPIFHATFVFSVLVVGAAVLAPSVPLGLVTIGVQALSGTLLPSASVLLLLICNDRAVLGPHTNSAWLNVIATGVVGFMLVLSALVSLTTFIPGLKVLPTALGLGSFAVLVLLAFAVLPSRPGPRRIWTSSEKATWTMPPLERLGAPERSWMRRYGLVILRGYLAFATILLIVKFVELAIHH